MQFKKYRPQGNCSEIVCQTFPERQKRNPEVLREKLYIQVSFSELLQTADLFFRKCIKRRKFSSITIILDLPSYQNINIKSKPDTVWYVKLILQRKLKSTHPYL